MTHALTLLMMHPSRVLGVFVFASAVRVRRKLFGGGGALLLELLLLARCQLIWRKVNCRFLLLLLLAGAARRGGH